MKTSYSRGFALLVAVIFMSVMLTLGLALGSLAYKQEVLASTAVDSQYAFYAADAALECALYADQQQDLFAFSSNLAATTPVMSCDGIAPVSAVTVSHTSSEWVTTTRLSLDNATHCADVTIYKPQSGTTYTFSEGYSVSCTAVAHAATNGVRFSARGLEAHY